MCLDDNQENAQMQPGILKCPSMFSRLCFDNSEMYQSPDIDSSEFEDTKVPKRVRFLPSIEYYDECPTDAKIMISSSCRLQPRNQRMNPFQSLPGIARVGAKQSGFNENRNLLINIRKFERLKQRQ